MNQALAFKIIHRRLKFRNPDHVLQVPSDFAYTHDEEIAAQAYLDKLRDLNINYTYPGDPNYPRQFHFMKEPPLFLEYKGRPFWREYDCLAVVGTRKIHPLSQSWLKSYFCKYLKVEKVCVVSGGAYGVDQLAHFTSIKEGRPTVVIVPSGLVDLYPQNLATDFNSELVCYLSEFEIDQPLRKSHFYFRNRLIAAMGVLTFMVQSDIKSGSFLTVHHALESGRLVVTLPGHPSLIGFDGNIKLLRDGAVMVSNELDLAEIWRAEVFASNLFNNLSLVGVDNNLAQMH